MNTPGAENQGSDTGGLHLASEEHVVPGIETGNNLNSSQQAPHQVNAGGKSRSKGRGKFNGKGKSKGKGKGKKGKSQFQRRPWFPQRGDRRY